MIKIAVCDDNQAICVEVEQMVLEYGKILDTPIELEVFNSGDEMLAFIKYEHSFDLIFLDIELGVTTGIDVGNAIREEFDDHISKIVFITAKQGYEEALFNIQPLNFLRKPIDKSKLHNCIKLTLKLCGMENQTYEYKKGYDICKVKVQNILYFEKIGKKIKIVMDSTEDTFYGALASIKSELPAIFVETHGSFLVNFEKIVSLQKDVIVLNHGEKLPVSQRNITIIRKLLLKLEREKI